MREYKRRGGKYKNSYESDSKLSQWFKEKWIDVCKLPKKVSCGRRKASMKKYPYCRPTVRVNSSTPKTVKEIGTKELKRRCSRKRKSPKRHVR